MGAVPSLPGLRWSWIWVSRGEAGDGIPGCWFPERDSRGNSQSLEGRESHGQNGFQVSSRPGGDPSRVPGAKAPALVPLEAWHTGSRWSLTKSRGPVAQAFSQGHLSGDKFVGDRDESAWWGAGGAALATGVSWAPLRNVTCGAVGPVS